MKIVFLFSSGSEMWLLHNKWNDTTTKQYKNSLIIHIHMLNNNPTSSLFFFFTPPHWVTEYLHTKPKEYKTKYTLYKKYMQLLKQ